MDSIYFKLIEAQATDVQLLHELAAKIWSQHYADILGASQIEYMLRHYQDTGSILDDISGGTAYFIAYYGDKPIGYLAYRPEAGRLYLSKLYLDQTVRGFGFGKNMLSAAEIAAKSAGLSLIYLRVNKYNVNTISFYRHAGFKTIDELTSDIGGGYVMDDYLMQKKVES